MTSLETEIEMNKIQYSMKRTLYHGEYKKFMKTMGFIAEMAPLIRSDSTTPEQLNEYANKIAKLQSDDYADLEKAVIDCYGLEENALEKMFEADILYLFSELFTASKDPKKKSPHLSVSA